MICEPCLSAAQGEEPRLPHCRTCRRQISVYATDVPREKQQIVIHKFPNTRIRCQGSRKPPATGHDLCNGCPCQHKPRGAWQKRELSS